MSRRPPQTLTDYVVIAISPALIMLLVGSLMFFLTNIFYDGQFPWRLRFSCAMFVLAAVLIARLSIDEGREYASMFAVPLGIVTLMAMARYTDAHWLLILVLIAGIWWCVDKLTWDCTVVDDRKDASGAGLLQTIGLDNAHSEPSRTEPDEPDVLLDAEATTSAAVADSASWWQRWLARRRRYHTPGVWVVYFCLASLPLFGVGQWLLKDSLAVRRSSFRLLIIYVASALALLMTTSFLQIRRYFRQRRLQMPNEMTGVWLGTGAVMIVALIVLCLLLPRPHSEYSLADVAARWGSSNDLRSSPHALGKEGIDSDRDDAGGTSQRNSEPDSGEKSEHSTYPETNRKPQPGQEQRSPSQDPSGRPGESPSPDGRTRGGGSDQRQSQANGTRDDDQSGRTDASSARKQPDGRQPDERKAAGQSRDNSPSEADRGGAKERSQSNAQRTQPRPEQRSSSPLRATSVSWESVFKLLYWAVLAIVIGFLAWRYRARLADAISAFLGSVAAMLRRLLGRDSRSEGVLGAADQALDAPLRRFADYPDPFATDLAQRFSPQQLVTYSFEALEAWARERGCGRLAEQTPLEFADQIHRRDRQIGPMARNLAVLYSQLAYAAEPLPTATPNHLRQLWTALRHRNETRALSSPR